MLNILHNKISQIADIISIEKIGDSYSIQYVDTNSITENQLAQINNIIENWPLDLAKINKLQLLDNKWSEDIKNGFTTIYGWKLGLTNNDVTLLTGAFLLGKEAHNMNISNSVTIIDIDGISHNIQIHDLTLLMLQYGQYRTDLSTSYSSKKHLIENANSISELENINIYT